MTGHSIAAPRTRLAPPARLALLARRSLLAAVLALAAGCSGPQAGDAAAGPPEVSVIVLRPQRIELTTQLPGRTVAYRIAQVRPQVSGIILKRLYTEGAIVQAGQPLYQLDPAPYQAAYESAQAALAKAQANVQTARLRDQRYQKLVTRGDVSQQDRDDAAASLGQAEADEATARAALKAARINLDYTRIVAPISGRISTSAYTEGALVTANQDSALTTVQQYAPMYVDLTQPAAAVLKLRSQLADGTLRHADARSASVRLQLEDGRYYAHEGRLEFTGITVSESTGAITLRAVFPNPDGVLLPGMYVRALLAQGVDEHALLVPQQAVSRDARGAATALVVGPGDKVEQRVLRVEPGADNRWRVLDGLRPGDRVIVQGMQKSRSGALVRPTVVDADAGARG